MKQKRKRVVLALRAYRYAQQTLRSEGAEDYGVDVHDLRLVPLWIANAWLAGYRAKRAAQAKEPKV